MKGGGLAGAPAQPQSKLEYLKVDALQQRAAKRQRIGCTYARLGAQRAELIAFRIAGRIKTAHRSNESLLCLRREFLKITVLDRLVDVGR